MRPRDKKGAMQSVWSQNSNGKVAPRKRGRPRKSSGGAGGCDGATVPLRPSRCTVSVWRRWQDLNSIMKSWCTERRRESNLNVLVQKLTVSPPHSRFSHISPPRRHLKKLRRAPAGRPRRARQDRLQGAKSASLRLAAGCRGRF